MQQQFIPIRILIDEEVETLFINKSFDREATSLENLLRSVIEKDMGDSINVMKFDSITKL